MVEAYLAQGVTMAYEIATESFYLGIDGYESPLATPYITDGR